MKQHRLRLLRPIVAALVAAGLAPSLASATDGYFSHGYGMRAKGMGGASFALALDAFGGANNPASMVFAGDRLDLGVDWFRPRREAQRTSAAPGLNGIVDSDSRDFFIPEAGYNRMITPDLSLGVTIYGNGGMNTDYRTGQLDCGGGPGTANLLCGTTALGVDLNQLIVAPTLAWKFHPDHAVGIAPLFAYQRFKAYGLQAFDNAPGFPPFTQSPGSVTNNGADGSTGWGVRVGYQGRLASWLRVGAVYASKMSMTEFDKYKGLFAEAGGFDIPEHYGAGFAVEPAPGVVIAVDYERINYSKVRSVGNPSSSQSPLGAPNGPGFGWRDVDGFRLGMQFEVDDRWTARAGFNHTDNPIASADVTFNIVAPGLVQDHVTFGAGYRISPKSEITIAYMHAFKNSISGPSLFNAVLGAGAGGTERIAMYQDSFGVAWSWKF
jgi:long-chain fatty acid transport protein